MKILEIKTPDGQVRLVELRANSYIVGRDPACDLSYPDGGLSRQHCSITLDGDSWALTDLNSRNGTFIRGERLTSDPRALKPGDLIQAGRLVISFRDAPDAQVPERAVVFEAPSGDESSRATVIINLRDLVGPEGAKALVADRQKPWASPVQALLRAGRELVAGRPLPQLFRIILDMAIEASGAERGVLMTLEDGELTEQARSEGEFRISSMVRNRVIYKRESLLIQDVLGDAVLQNRQSIVLQNVHTLMAVPLQTEDRVIGLIYVDSRSLLRPFTADDLNLLTVMANVAAIRIERQRLAVIEAAEERHRSELEQAASIQRLSLPVKAPRIPGFTVEGVSVPCFSVGGDYYDYLPLEDGRTMVVIGDVAGKGMPAALLVMSMQAHASAITGAGQILDPGQFVTQLNKSIIPRCPEDRFISFFACLLDPSSDELLYCNAGHNPPLLLRTTGETERLQAQGPVLALLPITYGSGSIRLGKGDQLLLYTDGITEAQNALEQEFDVPNLQQVLREKAGSPPASLLEEILASVEAWTGGAPASDDRTLVTIRKG